MDQVDNNESENLSRQKKDIFFHFLLFLQETIGARCRLNFKHFFPSPESLIVVKTNFTGLAY